MDHVDERRDGVFRQRRTYGPPGSVEQVETVHETRYSNGYLLARRVLYWVLGLIESLLAFRFALKLFGANPASPFAAFIYTITEIFVYPFTGLFPNITSGRSLFEPRTLVAMAVYAVVFWGIDRLLRILLKGDEPAVVD